MAASRAVVDGALDLFDQSDDDDFEPDDEAERERVFERAAEEIERTAPSAPAFVRDLAVVLRAESFDVEVEVGVDEEGNLWPHVVCEVFRLSPRQALARARHILRAFVAPIRALVGRRQVAARRPRERRARHARTTRGSPSSDDGPLPHSAALPSARRAA